MGLRAIGIAEGVEVTSAFAVGSATGATAIGAGVTSALAVGSATGATAIGAELLVITDGC